MAEAFSAHQVPVETPFNFSTRKSFIRQSLKSFIAGESRLKSAQQQETQNDTIASWECLEIFWNKLDVEVVNHKNSLIFTDEMFMLDQPFPLRGLLLETEWITWYYISGYVPFMANFAAVEPIDAKNKILRLFVNWFSKEYVLHESDK